jgi:uracil phosphoribosyltransferase
MNFQLVQHPIAEQALHYLRDASTDSSVFKHYCHQVSMPLIIEATKALPLKDSEVLTPLEKTRTREIESYPVFIPILRAGLGMLKVAQDLYPESKIGHVGMERDETTAVARAYYHKLPPIDGQHVMLLDPMLATGGSAAATVDFILEKGSPASMTLVSIVAAPEGIQCLNQQHPNLKIVVSAVDRELNSSSFIMPGLGDFGDRYFNT